MKDQTTVQNKLVSEKMGFGSVAVFMTSISTILGAILFLRFGYAVAHVGLLGTIGIILLGHLVTVPTAFAVAEIATNQKVLGGGAYYIISRSFGLNIGGAIGIALFFSQAISVAFYIIAFAEAFDPILYYLQGKFNIANIDNRFISIPSVLGLGFLVLKRGANVGMKALYGVVAILFLAILLFLFGKSGNTIKEIDFFDTIDSPDQFFFVFTIIFPAFTGLAAGLGLSGDLNDPQKAIPKGTLLATFMGFIVYTLVAFKLAMSATPEELSADQLIMQKIAVWGPIIPIGLAAASLSSAIGSILVAPRTLQAIGADSILPNKIFNFWVAKGKGATNEPFNASWLTVIIAFFFVAIGDIDFVAQIIAMFFMVTYGAICVISLLEHFAADPAYRPTFKSKWYLSFIGSVLSIWLMFKMNMPYAVLSILIMGVVYYFISESKQERKGLARLFKGVLFQLSRQLQILSQRANGEDFDNYWRPFIVCISKDSFKRRASFDLLRWISYKYGFGTYIHYIEGYLSKQTAIESNVVLEKLIQVAAGTKNRIYLDTIVSPSFTSALAQVIQLTGISGKGNNMILFEFSRTEPETLTDAIKNLSLLQTTGYDICILNTSYKGFGYKKDIHIWITSYDYENANLMILLGYIILGHPEWNGGVIKIFATYKQDEMEAKRKNLLQLIQAGRLPIAPGNIRLIPEDEEEGTKKIISEKSNDADLVVVGFRKELVKSRGIELFTGYESLGNILFVNSQKEKEIK